MSTIVQEGINVAIREYAVNFTVYILRHAKDWQEAQHALADHPTIGPWLRGCFASDSIIIEVQSIIREAEERLSDDLWEAYKHYMLEKGDDYEQ